MRCSAPPGYTLVPGDCDDGLANVNPSVVMDICDGSIDHNCDGFIDETCGCMDGVPLACGISTTGICTMGEQQCVGGMPQVCTAVFPEGTSETLCDGRDEDCDGTVDEMLETACYADGDADGFAAMGTTPTFRCVCGAGFTTLAPTTSATIDCDDATNQVNPNQLEVCDATNRDENCNGSVDENLRIACFPDVDMDGYAPTASTPIMRCGCLAGETSRTPTTAAFDCNDNSSTQHSGLGEACDAGMVDEDCDGTHNENCDCSGSATRLCTEAGFLGDCGNATQVCSGGGWGMCPSTIGTEACGGGDENCDGQWNENQTCSPATAPDGGSAPQACDNGCPTSATQPCTETCSWGACSAAEVCNYCDDDMDGTLSDDLALAGGSFAQTIADAGQLLVGDARQNGPTQVWVDDVSDLQGGHLGSALQDSFLLGYGDLVVLGDVNVGCNAGGTNNPSGGWSLFVMLEDGLTQTIGYYNNGGSPSERHGVAAVWNWAFTETATLLGITHPGAESVLASASATPTFSSGGCPAYVYQYMRLTVTPDQPLSATDELRVCVATVDSGGNVVQNVGCCNGAAQCQVAMQAGDRVRIGGSLSFGPFTELSYSVLNWSAAQSSVCVP
jgi:hypothetical protein